MANDFGTKQSYSGKEKTNKRKNERSLIIDLSLSSSSLHGKGMVVGMCVTGENLRCPAILRSITHLGDTAETKGNRKS